MREFKAFGHGAALQHHWHEHQRGLPGLGTTLGFIPAQPAQGQIQNVDPGFFEAGAGRVVGVEQPGFQPDQGFSSLQLIVD